MSGVEIHTAIGMAVMGMLVVGLLGLIVSIAVDRGYNPF